MENHNAEMVFDVEDFINYLENNRQARGDELLPPTTADDIKEYCFKKIALEMANPAFPQYDTDKYKNSNYQLLDVISTRSQVIQYEITCWLPSDRENIANKINQLVANDNATPTYIEVSVDKDLADYFNIDDNPKEFRDLTALKAKADKKFAGENLEFEFVANIIDLITPEDNLLEIKAVEKLLENETSSTISRETGIPQRTIIKYQKPKDNPDHRFWISDNTLKLIKYANKQKYLSYWG